MKNNRSTLLVLGISIILIGSVLPLVTADGCDPIVSLPPDPVTANMYHSYDDSYFKVTLSGVPAGYDVGNDVYNGWCIDYGPTITDYLDYTMQLYSSNCPPPHLQHDNWNYVNYILNHKQGTYNDIQNAIWYFIDFASGSPPAPTGPGQAMVDEALANGQSFVPIASQTIAVILDPVERGPGNLIQYTIIEVRVPDSPCDGNQSHCRTLSTSTTITGGSGGDPTNGNGAPIIKCKWEYDLDVESEVDECDPCPDCGQGNMFYHDACGCTDGLQVKPILGGDVTVGYYAILTDPEGVGQIDHVYADVWHPDGSFKYQIELSPITNITKELEIWDHVTSCHSDLIKYNGYNDSEIYDELWEGLAYIYYAEAKINYCQPGGWYYVGIRAHDTYDHWCEYLYNKYWYIPTSAIEVDFTNLDYGTVATSVDKWIGGDSDMMTSAKPTVRNIGNTPVELYVWQDDMDFGKTNGSWNVEFDARLGAPGVNGDVYYSPEQSDADHIGVRIPGVLPLCTQDKMDFSIHVYKGMPGYEYTGTMKLCAYIDHGSYVWGTPAQFLENAPNGVPDPYEGPADPNID